MNHSLNTKRSVYNLKKALFLGFCGICIVLARMAFRWHLKIPGHSMFFTIFFLFIARGVVQQSFSATVTGVLSGLLAMLMGMGEGGPLHLLKYALPAIAIDLSGMIYPKFMYHLIPCILVAAVASATRFFGNAAVDWIVGMETSIIFQHAFIQSLGAMLFGIAGSLLVPKVINRLEIHGFLDRT